MRSRSQVAFVAWGAVAGRSSEIAGALGGEVLCLYPPNARSRPPVLVRYALGAVHTVRWLARTRPRVTIVTNPPLLASLVVLLWSRCTGASVVLDSHPAAFGAQGDRVSARLLPVHRWIARRSQFSLVAAPKWQRIVEEWGGTAVVLHEAPGDHRLLQSRRRERLRVLYAGRLGPDEPYQVVVRAAARVPHCDVRVTGDAGRCPRVLREAAPANVRFIGFLDAADYRRELEEADVVVSLTTEPGSVMRAACEAVFAGKPLIVSDWPLDRELFPHALHVTHDVVSISSALERADREHATLSGRAAEARSLQLERWESQRRRLEDQMAPLLMGARGRGR